MEGIFTPCADVVEAACLGDDVASEVLTDEEGLADDVDPRVPKVSRAERSHMAVMLSLSLTIPTHESVISHSDFAPNFAETLAHTSSSCLHMAVRFSSP